MLTVKRLRQLLSYNKSTGIFRRKFTFGGKRKGSIAGSPCKLRGGYLIISVDNEKYYASRLAWFYVHGKWPKFSIDHKNGNVTDNRIINLREANGSQNIANSKLCKRNTSGYKGVHYDNIKLKWRARIMVKRKAISLGRFTTPKEANNAYRMAAKKYFGEFARW